MRDTEEIFKSIDDQELRGVDPKSRPSTSYWTLNVDVVEDDPRNHSRTRRNLIDLTSFDSFHFRSQLS